MTLPWGSRRGTDTMDSTRAHCVCHKVHWQRGARGCINDKMLWYKASLVSWEEKYLTDQTASEKCYILQKKKKYNGKKEVETNLTGKEGSEQDWKRREADAKCALQGDTERWRTRQTEAEKRPEGESCMQHPFCSSNCRPQGWEARQPQTRPPHSPASHSPVAPPQHNWFPP